MNELHKRKIRVRLEIYGGCTCFTVLHSNEEASSFFYSNNILVKLGKSDTMQATLLDADPPPYIPL